MFPLSAVRLTAALSLLMCLCFLTADRPASASLAPTLTYTGQLLVSGSPVSGTYDFQFSLYSASSGGTQVGSTLTVTSIPVADGVFYVELNFGSNIFTGAKLYLQTAYRVHPSSGSPAYTTQSPRKIVDTAGNADYAALSGSTQSLQGFYVSRTPPTNGQVLTYNSASTEWLPQALPTPPAYTAGAGLSQSGNQFSVASSGITSAMLGAGSVTASAISLPLTLSGSSSGAILTASNSDTSGGYGLFGTSPASGYAAVRGDGSSGAIGVNGNSDSYLGVYGTSNTGIGAYGYGSSGYGVYGYSNSGVGAYGYSGSGPGIYAASNGTSLSNPTLYVNNSNSDGIGIYSNTNSADANLVINNSGTGDLIKGFNGLSNIYFEVKANGTTVTRVLQITGGADVAEPYTVGAVGGVAPLPGMVVSIDPDHVGQMTLAHQSYDHAVAGIISGAGGIQPGLTLRQKDSVADGGLPVACTGRVWCWCDADANGAIKAGDLLTTSDTPGHAMRATDDARTRGAALGKAMSSLKSGKGLVLVLVTLQ